MSRYYGMDGNAIGREEALRIFGDDAAIRVAVETRGDVTVSTVLLVIDHNWTGKGDPLIFETMIFGGDHADYQVRYCTRDEALAGHARACQLAFAAVA